MPLVIYGSHPDAAADNSVIRSNMLFFIPAVFQYLTYQARDAKEIIANGYEAVDIQPFDLFPQTRHIENIITFQDAR